MSRFLDLALRTLFAAGALAPGLAAAGGGAPLCADDGHRHLPRWVPAELGLGDSFGAAVAIFATEAAVGSPGGDRVHVYRRDGAYWHAVQVLESPHGGGAGFGAALDIYSHTLVVGAPQDDLAGPDAGAVHVYQLQAGEFVLSQTLFSQAPEAGGHFGQSVGVYQSWLAAGEPGAGAGGRVALHRHAGGTWGSENVFEQPGSGLLGWSLDLSGADLLVGDPYDDTLGSTAGAVHLYALAPGSSSHVRAFYAADAQAGDLFGYSLAVYGDRLVVGAHGEDELGTSAGAAYLFAREPQPWPVGLTYAPRQKLLPCHTKPFARFGRSVAIQEGRIAVGAPFDGDDGAPGGRIYTFRRHDIFSETWLIEDEVRAADSALGDELGSAVGVWGEQVLAGAQRVDEAGSQAGAAYLVSSTPKTWGGGQAPSDALATVFSASPGKPGSLGIPSLSLQHPLVPGEKSLVVLQNALPGSVPVLVWGLQPGPIPFDGGTMPMSDPHLLPMPMVSGLGQVGLLLEPGPAPGLCGANVLLQAMFVDPGAGGPFQTAQSNGLVATIGH